MNNSGQSHYSSQEIFALDTFDKIENRLKQYTLTNTSRRTTFRSTFHNNDESENIKRIAQNMFVQLDTWTEKLTLQEKTQIEEDQKLYGNQVTNLQTIESMNAIQNKLIKCTFGQLKQKIFAEIQNLLSDWFNIETMEKSLKDSQPMNDLHNLNPIKINDIIYSELQQKQKISLTTHHSELTKLNKSLAKSKSQTRQQYENIPIQPWSNDLEKLFQLHIKNAQNNKIMNHVKHSNPKSKLISSFFKQSCPMDLLQYKRKELLEKYQEEGLSQEELQFIASTSQLINRDVSSMKMKLKCLDDDLVQKIELHVIENIIKDFQALKQQVIYQRNNFIRRRSFSLKKSAQDYSKQQIMKGQFSQSIQNAQNKLKSLSFQKNPEENIQIVNDRKQQGIFFKAIQDKVIKGIPLSDEEKNIMKYLHINQFKLDGEQMETSPIKRIKTDYSHNYHPNSRLLVFDKKQQYASRQDKVEAIENFKKRVQLERHKRVHINAPLLQKYPGAFRQVYTGGPVEDEQETELLNFNKLSVKELALLTKYAVLIQKNFRAFKSRGMITRTFTKEEKELVEKVKSSVDHLQYKKFSTMIKMFCKKHNSQPDAMNQGQVIYGDEKKVHFNMEMKQLQQVRSKQDNLQIHIGKQHERSQSVTFSSNQINFRQFKDQSNINQKQMNYQKSNILSRKRKTVSQVNTDMDASSLEQLFNKISVDEINTLDSQFHSPLYYACQKGKLGFCMFLISNKGDINQKCASANTALHVGIQSGNNNLIYYLLNLEQADWNCVNSNGKSPFYYASLNTISSFNLEDLWKSIGDRGMQDNNKILKQKRESFQMIWIQKVSDKQLLKSHDNLMKSILNK